MAIATVNYHVKSNEVQAFHFDVNGVVGNLISPELISVKVPVTDIRKKTYSVNFNKDGITFINAPTKVHGFDESEAWASDYESELTAILQQQIKAKEVIVFDHTVRIDDPNATRRPARNVHNDYSEAGVEKRLLDILGAQKAQEFQQGHFGFVNVWRPVEYTIPSSPLGFICPRSMQEDDWMNIELEYPDRKGQILGVAENKTHEWFYQSDMTPEEAIIFNIYDNRGRPHLAHSALDMEGDTAVTKPRKSIETRTLVRY